MSIRKDLANKFSTLFDYDQELQALQKNLIITKSGGLLETAEHSNGNGEAILMITKYRQNRSSDIR